MVRLLNNTLALTALAFLFFGSVPASAAPFAPFANPPAQSVIQIVASAGALCLDDNSTTGSPLGSQPCVASGSRQLFKFVSLGNGAYNIEGVASGLCLDSQGVFEDACASGLLSQQWVLNQNSDDSYNIVSIDKVHALSAASSAGKLAVAIYSPGSTAQEFNLSLPSYYADMPVQSTIQSGKYCIEDSDQGAQIGQQSCQTSGYDQQFSFESSGDGYFRIAGVNSNLCLDAAELASATLIETPCMAGVRSQEWAILHNLDGTYTISSFLGAYSLSAPAGAGAIQIASSHTGFPNQEFKINLPSYVTNPLVYSGGPVLGKNCPVDASVITPGNANGFNSNLPCIQSILGYDAIQDGGFQQGFEISSPTLGANGLNNITGTLNLPSNPAGSPSWTLTQVDSAKSIGPTDLTPTTNNTALWQDTYKSIQVLPGSYLELAVNGIAEWNNVPPAAASVLKAWPHLGITQPFVFAAPSQFQIPASQQAQDYAMPSLGHINHIYLSMTEQLRSIELGAAGSKNLIHTPIFIKAVNLNPAYSQAQGNGQGIFMNISGYDSLNEIQQPVTVGYAGSMGALAYSTGFPFWSPIQYNTYEPITYYGDLAPTIKQALANAFSQHALTSTNLNDYYIQSFSSGWEAPLNANGNVRMSNISLRVFDSYHPMPFEFNTNGDLQGWNMSMNGVNVPSELSNQAGAEFAVPTNTESASFTSPFLDIDAAHVNRVLVSSVYAPKGAGQSALTLRWQTTTSSGFVSSQSVTVANDVWNNTVFNMSQNPLWSGNIHQLQLTVSGATGAALAAGPLVIGHVRFSRAPVLNYYSSKYNYVIGTKFGPGYVNAPTPSSTAFLSYSVSPQLPAGLNFNTLSGAITPTTLTAKSPYAPYVVTGYSPEGNVSTNLTIGVTK
jgi:hypothetical protein